MDINKISAYELIATEQIPEVNSTGYLLSHKKTKARVVLLENDDDNKVFDIGFRTPPTDSTGVPHIIEHTVLCGSRKFPVKDPFAEMDKGSLNTFLNAMTYPDKTVYPVASVNDKDFRNLMDVYLDAVFFPNIYKEEKIFRQEGWHYEMESVDGDLTYNGVVFNEMKGAFSAPDEYFETLIQETLFPDTAYGVVSGGDPKVIPELEWEDYLDFHRRYYHPSNSYIYLYGNMDFEEKLNWIDEEYLSKFDYLEVDSAIRTQEPIGELKEAEGFYPIPAGEETEGKTYFAYTGVCGTTLDPKVYQAFQVLEYALVEAIGAPVKEALVKAGIGTEIEGCYNEPFAQPFFTISAKNARDDQKDEFVKTIRETLTDLAENGINKRSLKAALNAMEFQFREADFGRFPKGLMYGLGIYDSWLYDDRKPFIHLHVNETFAFLREQIETGYYEDLIRKYFLDNPHSAVITLRPKPGMAAEIDEEEKNKLRLYLDKLSEDDKERIVAETSALKKYQEEPSTPEEMATIPLLGREDIGKKARPFSYEEREIAGSKTIFNEVFTNGISYIKFSFDISDLEKYAPYIGLTADILGAMDTDTYDKLELSNELLLHAGGYSITTSSYTDEDTDRFTVRIELNMKVLYHETEKMMEILDDIIQKTHLDDTERLKEIIAERRSGRQAALPASGHMTATNRALSYFRDRGRWSEELKGLSYYDFLCEVDDNFDKYKDNLVKVLEWLRGVIFTKDRLVMNIVTTDEGYKVFEKAAPVFTDGLKPESDVAPWVSEVDRWNASGLKNRESSFEGAPAPAYELRPIPKNEGITTAGNVWYVARCGNFRDKGIDSHGSFRVLKTILSYEYLWNEVRVKGGAYGVMCNFSHLGTGYMVSYRDPHIKETVDIYKSVPEYLKSFEIEERDMVKFIIGTVRTMDLPLTPRAEGARAYDHYMNGRTIEEIQKTRDEVLETTRDDIRKTAEMVEAVLSDGYICVVGGEDKVRECADMFGTVRALDGGTN